MAINADIPNNKVILINMAINNPQVRALDCLSGSIREQIIVIKIIIYSQNNLQKVSVNKLIQTLPEVKSGIYDMEQNWYF